MDIAIFFSEGSMSFMWYFTYFMISGHAYLFGANYGYFLIEEKQILKQFFNKFAQNILKNEDCNIYP